jgi:hypothetical protein
MLARPRKIRSVRQSNVTARKRRLVAAEDRCAQPLGTRLFTIACRHADDSATFAIAAATGCIPWLADCDREAAWEKAWNALPPAHRVGDCWLLEALAYAIPQDRDGGKSPDRWSRVMDRVALLPCPASRCIALIALATVLPGVRRRGELPKRMMEACLQLDFLTDEPDWIAYWEIREAVRRLPKEDQECFSELESRRSKRRADVRDYGSLDGVGGGGG